MLGAATYLILGWLLIAITGGLADVLGVTIMLPSTSAVVVAHAAFAPGVSRVAGLAVAVGLGYLEDLHQGAPVGTLALAHALAYLALGWASRRLAVRGWLVRAFVGMSAILLVDLATFGVLWMMADPFGIRREALLGTVPALRWHALATLLVTPPVWALLDRLFTAFRLDDGPAPGLQIGIRRR